MNRKNLKIWWVLPAALLLAMLTACSPQQDEALPGGGGPALLGVDDVFITGTGSATRTNTLLAAGKLWLSIRNSNGYIARQGLVYTYGGGAWNCPTSVILNANPISLYAYYPQDKFGATGDVVSFSAREYSADNDLCYATASKADVNAANPGASFVLKHAYARISLSVTRIASFTGTGNITGCGLKAGTGNIDLTGALDVNAGTITSSGASNTGFSYGLNTTVAAGTANTACDMLVPPQATPADGLTITLTIDGNARSVTIPKDKFGDALKANTRYTISLEIEGKATLVVAAGTVTETGWKEPTGGDFGGAEDSAPI